MRISTNAADVPDDDDHTEDLSLQRPGANQPLMKAKQAKKVRTEAENDATDKAAKARDRLPDFNITVYVLAVTYRQVWGKASLRFGARLLS